MAVETIVRKRYLVDGRIMWLDEEYEYSLSIDTGNDDRDGDGHEIDYILSLDSGDSYVDQDTWETIEEKAVADAWEQIYRGRKIETLAKSYREVMRLDNVAEIRGFAPDGLYENEALFLSTAQDLGWDYTGDQIHEDYCLKATLPECMEHAVKRMIERNVLQPEHKEKF